MLNSHPSENIVFSTFPLLRKNKHIAHHGGIPIMMGFPNLMDPDTFLIVFFALGVSMWAIRMVVH